MSDPNPYQPPQTPQALRPGQIIKRAIGLGAILLLTPPAVLLTLVIGCGIERLALRFLPLDDLRLGFAFLLPLIVLAGLMAWAVWTENRQHGSRNKRRIRLLLLTPIVVSAMGAVGFGLVVAVGLATYGRDGFPFPWFAYVLVLLFLLPPGIALVWMLSAAWREDEEMARPRYASRSGDE